MRTQQLVALQALLLLFAAQEAAVSPAATCARWGSTQPPASTSLAADATNSAAAVIVTTECVETPLQVSTTIASESVLDVSSKSLAQVVSIPQVDKLIATNNKIKSFKAAVDSGLQTLDLANNDIVSLDQFSFPSTLQSLDLSDNSVTASRAAQFPSGLSELYLRKNGIKSMSLLDFPLGLTLLSLDGNPLSTLKGAILPSALESLTCQNCKITMIEGVRFPATLKKLEISGTDPLTSFVVRASDVANLKNVGAGGFKSAVTSCAGGGTLNETKGGIVVCSMDDKEFDAKYPQRSASSKATPSSSSTGTPSSSATTPSADSPNANANTDDTNNSNNGSSGSSSSMYLLVGLLVLAAVVVGAVIGFVMQRRKRKPMRASDLRDLLAEAAATTNSSSDKGVRTVTGRSLTYGIEVTEPVPGSGSRLARVPSSASSGYFTNDVRTDEELLPYRLPREDVQLVRELATGGFGIVYLATCFGEPVVVKQIVPTKMQSTAVLKRFMAEIRLYARLEHPKIARFIGVSWTTLFDLSLVMEYLPNGDLSDVLKRNRALPHGRDVFTWFSANAQPRCKTLIALDIAEALVYLHSFEPVIIHRDLKSKNVLLAADWTAKLADFGISREAAVAETMTGGMGTTAWIAPEVLQGERYAEKADIYSFGIVLSELDTCGHPYNSNRGTDESLTDPKIAVLVSTDAIKPTIETDCPAAIRALILSCVAHDPAARPSAMELHFRLRTIRNEHLAQGLV